jgi:Uri superfamily endonuclease
MSEQTGGTYTLVIELPERAAISVGALGEQLFDAGWYGYVGSALGSGGFARIDRHRELAAGKRETRHWHIDYLLGHAESRLDAVVRTSGVDGECAVAETVETATAAGFGCSDCGCETHLFVAPTREELLDVTERAHEPLAGETVISY